MRKNLFIGLLSLVLIAGSALISAGSAEASSRSLKKFGISISLLGDPAPSFVGYNIHYNLTSFMRLNAGYGSFLAGSTYGGGARFFVPDWNFSPFVGLSYAKFNISGTLTSDSGTAGLLVSQSYAYASYGFDWQTDYGLNFAFGVNQIFVSDTTMLPFFSLGWFF